MLNDKTSDITSLCNLQTLEKLRLSAQIKFYEGLLLLKDSGELTHDQTCAIWELIVVLRKNCPYTTISIKQHMFPAIPELMGKLNEQFYSAFAFLSAVLKVRGFDYSQKTIPSALKAKKAKGEYSELTVGNVNDMVDYLRAAVLAHTLLHDLKDAEDAPLFGFDDDLFEDADDETKELIKSISKQFKYKEAGKSWMNILLDQVTEQPVLTDDQETLMEKMVDETIIDANLLANLKEKDPSSRPA